MGSGQKITDEEAREVLDSMGIRPENIKTFEGIQNPTSQNFIIDNTYFLKTIRKNKTKESLVKEYLNNIPTLSPVKVTTHDNRRFELYDYIEQEDTVIFKKIDPKTMAEQLAKISEVRIPESVLTTNQDLENIRCVLEEIASKHDNEALKKAVLLLKEKLFAYLVYFNKNFSHGDMHPGNILIRDGDVRAFIDWELSGAREELYDLGFFIGCIGITDPNELIGSYVKELIQTYINQSRPSKLAILLLPEMVLATRIIWLDKWLEIGIDKDMIEMETALMKILTENMDKLRSLWSTGEHKYSKNRWVMQDANLVTEVNKAKERMLDFDIFDLKSSISTFKDSKFDENQLSTDLRLLGIDYGMKDDIVAVLSISLQLEKLAKIYPGNRHIQIERVLMIGNSCLDLGKFRMLKAQQYTIEQINNLIDSYPDIDELKIGLAFAYRNSSIANGEIGEFAKAFEKIEELRKLTDKTDNLEIKGEYARSLSNGITTILSNNLDKTQSMRYYSILKDLHQRNTYRKIDVAYRIAKTNLQKVSKK